MAPARFLEIFLGITGAVVGVLAIPEYPQVYYGRESSAPIQFANFVTVILAVVVFIALAFVRKRPAMTGIVLVGVAVVGLVTVQLYYVPASIFLVLAGLFSIFRKT